MFTRNYDNCKTYADLQAQKMRVDNIGPQMFYNVKTDGVRVYFPRSLGTGNYDNLKYTGIFEKTWVVNNHLSATLNENQITIDFGTGDRAESYEDYELESPCTASQITKTIVDIAEPVYNETTGKWSQIISIDFKNITEEDIYFKEYGVYSGIYAMGQQLFEREVLAESVRIPAGKYYRFDYTYTFGQSRPRSDMISDTWEEIIANAEAGTVDGYSIGQFKPLTITLDGTERKVNMVIVGKSHDTISGTEDKAALTFMMEDPVLKFKMNDSNTNTGGWPATKMRTYLNETMFAGLPAALQSAIKTVDKGVTTGPYVTEITQSEDKVWLPCFEEIGLTYGQYREGQGTVYEYFDSVDNRRLIKYYNAMADWWWTRAVPTPNNYAFCYVTSSGGANTNNASSEGGVVAGFCI